jgi:ABC-type bacteriocin/lantibiotic exporter with double-glycine peptidase domain
MKTPEFFKRSELTSTLWSFRREFLIVGAFSMIANVLMLTPTLYMLHVYDRVLASQSELTLLAMSLLALFLFAVMAFAEWMRSRVLVSTGVRLDDQLSTQVFNASFEAHLSQSGTSPSRAFGDLIQIRQFLTGNGIFAFFDAPWTPIYMAVLFFLHPLLGVLGHLLCHWSRPLWPGLVIGTHWHLLRKLSRQASKAAAFCKASCAMPRCWSPWAWCPTCKCAGRSGIVPMLASCMALRSI